MQNYTQNNKGSRHPFSAHGHRRDQASVMSAIIPVFTGVSFILVLTTNVYT